MVIASHYRTYWYKFGLLAMLLAGFLPAGCQAEQRPGAVQTIGTPKTGSVSQSVSGAGIETGVVQPPPAGATQVNVVLREWSIEVSPKSVKAGQIYFLVDNQGPNDPHEIVIIKSDIAPDKLPVTQGRVPEDQVKLIGEVEAFAPKSKASGVFNLEPGSYALICNIAEMEGGQLESHYQMGMSTTFTVTP